MPNDCSNSFTITGITVDQWQKLARTFQVHDPEHQQEFLKTFYPEPDYTVTPVAMTYPEISAQHAKTEEERETILMNAATIREDSWWDWRVQHWGTKWDVYSCCNDWENEKPSNEFSANFCTAWSPLGVMCMAVLSRKFPGSLLTNFYEEEGMDFFGVTIAKDGKVRDFSDSISKYREAFMRQQFPDLDARLDEAGLNPEDDLDEFFWDNCDPGEFSDFLYNSLDDLVATIIDEVNETSKDTVLAPIHSLSATLVPLIDDKNA
jgi:hypothetical protein